jgi:hypothetical protein
MADVGTAIKGELLFKFQGRQPQELMDTSKGFQEKYSSTV